MSKCQNLKTKTNETMAGFVYTFSKFMRNIKESGDDVNITGLINDWKVSSPISLSYDVNTFERYKLCHNYWSTCNQMLRNSIFVYSNLAPTILKNFCANYQNRPIFHLRGLRALESIVNKELDQSTIAQKTVCVHLVKMQDREKNGFKLSNLLVRVNETLYVIAPDNWQEKWIELAKKVFKHPQVISVNRPPVVFLFFFLTKFHL